MEAVATICERGEDDAWFLWEEAQELSSDHLRDVIRSQDETLPLDERRVAYERLHSMTHEARAAADELSDALKEAQTRQRAFQIRAQLIALLEVSTKDLIFLKVELDKSTPSVRVLDYLKQRASDQSLEVARLRAGLAKTDRPGMRAATALIEYLHMLNTLIGHHQAAENSGFWDRRWNMKMVRELRPEIDRMHQKMLERVLYVADPP